MSAKPRLTSTVVVSQSFQKRQERRERPRRYSENEERGTRKYTSQHDDRTIQRNNRYDRQEGMRNDKSHMRARGKFVDDEEDSNGDKNRRGWQSEKIDKVSVFDRLSSGFARNQQREEREIIVEVETDPRDVPRGKRYFEHDDRGADRDRGRGYGNQNFNSRIPRQPLQRHRSRSPVWKHDRYREPERKERGFANRRQIRSSPVWKHDKFEEQETTDDIEETTDRQTDRHVYQGKRKSR